MAEETHSPDDRTSGEEAKRSGASRRPDYPIDQTPERRSLYDVLRRRVAPVAFFIVLALLAGRTCASAKVDVELRIELGPAASQVQALRVDVFARGAQTSQMALERRYGAVGAPPRAIISAQLSSGTYEVALTVTTSAGVHRIDRVIEVTDRSVISLSIANQLSNL